MQRLAPESISAFVRKKRFIDSKEVLHFQTLAKLIKSPRSARSFLVGVTPFKAPSLYP